ncbi:MAG: type II toxin-antitoxin system RelE/ParE family toxin [Eggerthellaceae bacterium]|nr:type II toxin-antitoxin system RelE/ParE family toxin [Eggerthellaceae bacterium]
MPKRYRLQYLPIFWDDLLQALLYIRDVLENPLAAQRLADQVEQGILEHLENPTNAAIYKTTRSRRLPYYWFPVGNYMVLYVVDNDVMEVRRFAYGSRDLTKIVV